jgi:hypothetical protein
MTVNAELARIFGSDFDAINLAPFGTTLPTTLTGPLDPAFEDVGWLHSDGVTESLTGSVNKIRGHQGQAVVRTRVTESGTTYAFHALETKKQTQALRYHEKQAASAAGVRTVTRGPGQRVAVRSAVIDFFDADDDDVQERLIIPRFEIVQNGDRVYGGTDIAGFPFIGEIIGDYTHLMTDLEAAEEGGA